MKLDYLTLKGKARTALKKIESKVGVSAEPSPKRVETFSAGLGKTPVQSVTKKIEVVAGQNLIVSIESISNTKERGAALFEIIFKDSNGENVEFAGWPHRSAQVGNYFYLTPSDGEVVLTQETLVVPTNASSLELIGHSWKRGTKTWLSGDVVVNIAGAANMAPTASGKTITYPSSALSIEREIPTSVKKIELIFSHKADTQKSSAPVKIWFSDQNGEQLAPIAELPQNATFGPFVSLNGEPGEEKETRQMLQVPAEACSVHLEGLDWGKKTPLLTAPVELQFPDEDALSVEEFIDSVPSDAPLIIIDTTAPPLGHKTLSLRPNNLTMAYERLGAWVIFIPFGSVQDQEHHHSDHVFQIDRSDFDLMIQKSVDSRNPENSYFICSSFPSMQSLTAVNYLKTRGWNTMYECRDDMEEFNRVGYSKWYSPTLERHMVTTADQVVSVSTALDQKLCALAPKVKVHDVIPNAVNRHVIDNGSYLRTPEALEARQYSKILGYVGHLTDSWFDWPYLFEVAQRLPGYTFEIIGHGAPKNLQFPENVHLLGAKSHDELPEIVARWKVALIPFKDMPLTRSVDPNKIYEYFAWGMRCVTAPMGMVEKYPSTWVYQTVDQFEAALVEAVESEFTLEELQILEEFVQGCDWDDRARQMFAKLGIEVVTPAIEEQPKELSDELDETDDLISTELTKAENGGNAGA